MDSLKPSFMLLPNFTFLPQKDILLGTIVPKGKESQRPDPRRPLNKSTRIDPSDPSKQEFQPWSWDSEKQKSANAGVDADLSIFTGIGGGVEGEIGATDGLKITCDKIVIDTFLPDAEYVSKAVQSPNVQTLLKKYTHPSGFLVTGTMVAHGAKIEVKRGTKRGGKVGAGADLTPAGAPVKIGAQIGGDVDIKSTLITVPAEPFLLGYQLVRIRRKLNGTYEDADENKWALFNDDVNSSMAVNDDLVITQVATEIDLEGV